MSYVERALWWFLKKRVFGGFATLREKQYVGFLIFGVIVLSANTLLMILFQTTALVSAGFLQGALLLETVLALSFFVVGIVAGRSSPLIGYVVGFSILGVGGIVCLLFLPGTSEAPVFQVARLAFIIGWALISTLSMFFLGRAYFTSLAGKFVAIGNPKDRIFFQPIVRFVGWVTLSIFIYMTLTPDGLWVGLLGLVYSIMILSLLHHVKTNPGVRDFSSILGYFNVYMLYHLISAFSTTSTSLADLLLNIALNLFISLYVIQSWTRRLSQIDEIFEIKAPEDGLAPETGERSPVPAHLSARPPPQQKLVYSSKAKKIFGEKGLVMFAFAMVFGNQAVFLGTYLGSTIPLLSLLSNSNLVMPALYHRLFLLCGIFIAAIAFMVFLRSPRFQQFVTNQYSYKDIIPILMRLFRKGDEGEPAPVTLLMQKAGEFLKGKTHDVGQSLKEKKEQVRENWQHTKSDIGTSFKEMVQEIGAKAKKIFAPLGKQKPPHDASDAGDATQNADKPG